MNDVLNVVTYHLSGIKNPKKGVDLADVFDAFSYMELMWMEALEFCERGGDGAMIESGATEMNGSLPVNPSGGVLSAHPVIAAGLVRIAEAVLQLRGEACAWQVEGAQVTEPPAEPEA